MRLAASSRGAMRGVGRLVFAMAALCGLLILGHAAAIAQDRPASCRLAVPDVWQGAAPEWTGPCVNGAAHGLGVATARLAGGLTERFFGRVIDGHMNEGVFEVPGGYRPARFKDATMLSLDDRNQIIAVFRVAARAARDISDQYRTAGNTKAARDYAEAARSLASQMD